MQVLIIISTKTNVNNPSLLAHFVLENDLVEYGCHKGGTKIYKNTINLKGDQNNATVRLYIFYIKMIYRTHLQVVLLIVLFPLKVFSMRLVANGKKLDAPLVCFNEEHVYVSNGLVTTDLFKNKTTVKTFTS